MSRIGLWISAGFFLAGCAWSEATTIRQSWFANHAYIVWLLWLAAGFCGLLALGELLLSKYRKAVKEAFERGRESATSKQVEAAVAPKTPQIPDIGGEIIRVRLNHPKFTFSHRGGHMVGCQLGLDLSIGSPETESIEITRMMITAWPCSNLPIKMVNIHTDLGIPFTLQGARSLSVTADIEFLMNDPLRIPAFLLMLVDQYNGKHFLPLRSGITLPEITFPVPS